MSDGQPTHKVVFNNTRGYIDAEGIEYVSSYEVVPVNEEFGYTYEVEGKRGTFEECQAYAAQLNEGMAPIREEDAMLDMLRKMKEDIDRNN